MFQKMAGFALTRNQLRLIALLAARPEPDVSVREAGRYLAWPASSASRVVRSLEKLELLSSSRRGRLKLVRLNPDHPVYQEAVTLARRYYGVVPLLRTIVRQIEGVSLAIVYGSAAAGKLDDRGVIDLLIVGQPDKLILKRRFGRVARLFGREVNWSCLSPREFIFQKQKSSFLKSVLQRPIVELSS